MKSDLLPDPLSISNHFTQYLTAHLALDDERKREVFQLRHRVYCEELHYEEVQPQHIEQDDFDQRAVHCAIRHHGTGQLAGTVRVIGNNTPDERLPLQQFCAHAITHESLAPHHFPYYQICELSRLAVPALFRKRSRERAQPDSTTAATDLFSTHELRAFPYIATSLYLSIIALCHKTRRVHVFLMIEPRLARSLHFVGIYCTQLGPVIDYHGLRAAYYIDVREARKTLKPAYRNLLDRIEAELFGQKG